MTTTINAKSTGIGGLDVTGDASGALGLQTGGVTAVTIDTSQNVGIGVSSPNGKVEVNGRVIASDGNGASRVALNIESNTAAQSYAAINAYNYGTSTARNLSLNESGGNVGIGTTSPSQKLSISGSAPRLWLTDTTASGSVGELAVDTSAFGIFNRSNLPMTFGTNNTERMRIDSSGNVLIGTTSFATGQDAVSLSSTNRYFSRNGTANAYQIQFANSNGYVGRIDTTGTATGYVTSSDYRLKENIMPMTDALNKVAQLNPVNWIWKTDGTDGQGFIAHELAEVCPQAVSGEKDAVDADGNPVYQGIDTSFLVATLTAAIQELKAIVDAQQKRIEALESK